MEELAMLLTRTEMVYSIKPNKSQITRLRDYLSNMIGNGDVLYVEMAGGKLSGNVFIYSMKYDAVATGLGDMRTWDSIAVRVTSTKRLSIGRVYADVIVIYDTELCEFTHYTLRDLKSLPNVFLSK